MITDGRVFFLDLGEGRIMSVAPDGSDLKVLVEEGRKLPDGLAIDPVYGHLYWTNMGDPKAPDGAILRSDLDGANIVTIVPPGATFTPKQLQIEPDGRKLYWSDREGMRVMRAGFDGSNIETLVDSSKGDARPGADATKWCVGIAVDAHAGRIYWSQKGHDDAGEGRIFRAGIQIPAGETAANRTDIEVLYEGLPEPIDLEIDHVQQMLYWTDRGDPPRGNTVNRAPIDAPANARPEPEIVMAHLMEGIGLALDQRNRRMFVTDFAGSLYSADLDGRNRKTLLVARGNLTGVAYFEPPNTNKACLS